MKSTKSKPTTSSTRSAAPPSAKKKAKSADGEMPAKSKADLAHHDPSEPPLPTLSTIEHKLLAEALRRGETAREGMEDILRDYGSWLFVNVFDSDSSMVLDKRREHGVWSHLVARAGGPTLRINEPMLHVCLLSAAYDKRLNDDSWRALDLGRKQLLLRLKTDAALRKGAHHVLAGKLSWRATREYVRTMMESEGEAIEIRVSVGQVQNWLRGFQARLSTRGFQVKLEAAAKDAPAVERKKLHRQIDALQRELAALASRLSG